MPARKRIARATQEIMEDDITIAIKKAKVRFRFQKLFYIFKYTNTFFASGFPENDGSYFQKWQFNEKISKWEEN